MSAPLTSPLGGDDLAKALRDAYGQGRRSGADRPIEQAEIIAKARDAWIAQYIARLPAAEPIAAAPEARAGEDAGREAWADLSPQEIVRRTRCKADCDLPAYSAAVWRECCDLILNRLGPQRIPSRTRDINPEVELSEPKAVTIDYVNWRGEQGRRRILPTGRIVYGATEWHPQHQWLLEAMDLDKSAVRFFAFVDMQMLAPSPATPEATPKSSPDQTPVDPQMAVEEVALVKDALIQARGALHLDAMLDEAGKPYGTTAVAQEAIELALRTLQASGEVRS